PEANRTLLKVAAPPRFRVALLVEKTTLPLLWEKTPAASVRPAVTVSVAVVLVKEPPAATVRAPFRLMVALLPLKVPPEFTAVVPVTASVEPPALNVPADWVYDVVRVSAPAPMLTVPA